MNIEEIPLLIEQLVSNQEILRKAIEKISGKDINEINKLTGDTNGKRTKGKEIDE